MTAEGETTGVVGDGGGVEESRQDCDNNWEVFSDFSQEPFLWEELAIGREITNKSCVDSVYRMTYEILQGS